MPAAFLDVIDAEHSGLIIVKLIGDRKLRRVRRDAVLRDVDLQIAGRRVGRHLEVDLVEADEAGRESGEDDVGRLRFHRDNG